MTNQPWNLSAFVDALVVELDKARETLSIKAINNPLSYAVKDMALDLQIFPTYDGDEVRFTTAKPGDSGSSKISLQLASISDRQVRESSKRPASKGDIKIDEIEIDGDIKNELRKIGVTSVSDLNKIEQKNVDLESVVKKKTNYSELADIIRGSRRSKQPPKLRGISLSDASKNSCQMDVEGEDLLIDHAFAPVVVMNGELVDLLEGSRNKITFSCPSSIIHSGDNELVMVLDPYSVVKVNVQNFG